MSDPDDAPSGGGPDDRGPDDRGVGDRGPGDGRPGDGGPGERRPTGGRSGDGGPDDEELAEMADDLSDVLRDLRDELRASREARGGEPVDQSAGSTGVGVPDVSIDLPSATDVLAFTDEKLIPAAITVLEVNIKALELLQKGIRWARPDRAGENARAVQSHAESVSRSTLQRLDTVLADLQDAASEGALPENAEASGIITEARKLRDEIDTALAERAEARDGTGEPDALPGDEEEGGDDGPPSPWDEPPEVDVDVEGELQSIKAELGKVDDEDPDDDDEDLEDGEDSEDGGDSDDEGIEDGVASDDENREDDGASEEGTTGDDGGSDEPATEDDERSADESGSDGGGAADGRDDGGPDPANEAERGSGADRDVDPGDADDGSDPEGGT